MNIFLYQIQYDDNTAVKENTGLYTFDCRENPEFLKREIAHLIRFYDEIVVNANDDDYFGLFSPKFEQKSGLKIQQIQEFISENEGYDVYLFNPFPMLVYKHMNMWTQGELCHPGVIEIVDELFEKTDVDFKVSALYRQNNKNVVYCNYWVGKKVFFDDFMSFLKKINRTIESNLSIQKKIYTSTDYDLSDACFYPFIFERMLSTYLSMNPEINVIPYEYTKNDIVVKKLNVIERKFYLSSLRADFDVWELKNANDLEEIKKKILFLNNFLRPQYGNQLIESIMRKINRLCFNFLRRKILSTLNE